jgi:hypothetical protein
MSAIQKIVDSINKVINAVRVPVIPISATLLLCNVFKRPGLSAMMIAANVIKRQNEFGAPTGTLPVGSKNMMNALIYVMSEEIVKELQKNCVIEGVVPPGTMVLTGTGANAGGPVVIQSTNILPVKITGLLR